MSGMAKPEPGVNLRRYSRHLVKSIWRHNSVGDHRIWTKFGRLVQNHMPTAVKRSIWKPELQLFAF